MNCIYCKKPILKERLEILPDTETCVKCSKVKKKISLIHGTASGKGSELVFYEGNDKLALKHYRARKGRNFLPGKGSTIAKGW